MDRVIIEPCQMRIETDHPCPRPVTMELWSVPLYELCAREQEAYFVISKITQELSAVRTKRPRGARRGLLAGALYSLLTNLDGRVAVKSA